LEKEKWEKERLDKESLENERSVREIGDFDGTVRVPFAKGNNGTQRTLDSAVNLWTRRRSGEALRFSKSRNGNCPRPQKPGVTIHPASHQAR